MSRRVGLALWLIVGVAVWSEIFDLQVANGAREYLQLQAEFELGRVPRPSMTEVMDRAKHRAAISASIWASLVAVCGGVTVISRAPRDSRGQTVPGASHLS